MGRARACSPRARRERSRRSGAGPPGQGPRWRSRAAGAHRSLRRAPRRRAADIDRLMSLVDRAPVAIAEHALAALAVYRYDDALRSRVDAAVRARANRPLARAFAEAFSAAEAPDDD